MERLNQKHYRLSYESLIIIFKSISIRKIIAKLFIYTVFVYIQIYTKYVYIYIIFQLFKPTSIKRIIMK